METYFLLALYINFASCILECKCINSIVSWATRLTTGCLRIWYNISASTPRLHSCLSWPTYLENTVGKKVISAPKQVQNFLKMRKILKCLGPIGIEWSWKSLGFLPFWGKSWPVSGRKLTFLQTVCPVLCFVLGNTDVIRKQNLLLDSVYPKQLLMLSTWHQLWTDSPIRKWFIWTQANLSGCIGNGIFPFPCLWQVTEWWNIWQTVTKILLRHLTF